MCAGFHLGGAGEGAPSLNVPPDLFDIQRMLPPRTSDFQLLPPPPMQGRPVMHTLNMWLKWA